MFRFFSHGFKLDSCNCHYQTFIKKFRETSDSISFTQTQDFDKNIFFKPNKITIKNIDENNKIELKKFKLKSVWFDENFINEIFLATNTIAKYGKF
jgi:hypothetical protein